MKVVQVLQTSWSSETSIAFASLCSGPELLDLHEHLGAASVDGHLPIMVVVGPGGLYLFVDGFNQKFAICDARPLGVPGRFGLQDPGALLGGLSLFPGVPSG